MNTYILLTKLSPNNCSTDDLTERGTQLPKKLQETFPKVKWIANYAVCGPYDFMDIFEAETNEVAMKVSVVVRQGWNAYTELWPVTHFDMFKSSVLFFEENIHEKQPAEDMVDEVAMDSFPASDPPATSSIT
jgi:uncharacterized protein with GYD domain